MKRLYLMRHAKSDWDAPASDDHERPLTPRGVRAAKLMGRLLAAAGQAPDAVVASSAVRARTTVELMAAAGGWTCPVRVTRSLYESGPESALAEIRKQPDDAVSLLVAGHEPTWSALVEALCGGRVRMVTGALARIDFAVDRWADVEPGGGWLVWLAPPKLLQAAEPKGTDER
jgi:phosphohistidine phosphatase